MPSLPGLSCALLSKERNSLRRTSGGAKFSGWASRSASATSSAGGFAGGVLLGEAKGRGRGLAMKLILMGDVNLLDVTTSEEPVKKILGKLHAEYVVFGNLEGCPRLPASRQSDANEGFFADPVVGGEAIKLACIHAVGIANNVNYGATSIAASIARLDEVGILHTGAGPNLTAARAPAVVERNGLRVGVLQRSSVYWPTDHEARD